MTNQYNEQDQILIPSGNGYIAIPAHNIRGREPRQRKNSVVGAKWLMFRLKDSLTFLFMMSGMILILGAIGYTVAGVAGVLVASLVTLSGFFITSGLKIEQILKRKQVQMLHLWEGRRIHEMVEKLAQKAGLNKLPALFIDFSPEVNAYTLEDRDKAAIVLSRGLLNNLNPRELNGVLAHEIAHLKNNDIRLMVFTEQIRRLTGYMAFFGQVLFLFNLPLLLLNMSVIPWLPILLLMVAPMISHLFHYALSRNREFRADLDAVALSNDTIGLANALRKISRQMGFWQRLYAPYMKNIPEILRTHPNTHARIERLGEIKAEQEADIGWAV